MTDTPAGPAVAHLILVTGSHLDDVAAAYVRRRLDEVLVGVRYLQAKLAILHGAAEGVDATADSWAREHDIEVHSIDAEWQMWGGMAGEIRNRKLLQLALLAERSRWAVRVMAFPGRSSRGTWNMVQLARDAGLRVEICVDERGEG